MGVDYAGFNTSTRALCADGRTLRSSLLRLQIRERKKMYHQSSFHSLVAHMTL